MGSEGCVASQRGCSQQEREEGGDETCLEMGGARIQSRVKDTQEGTCLLSRRVFGTSILHAASSTVSGMAKETQDGQDSKLGYKQRPMRVAPIP